LAQNIIGYCMQVQHCWLLFSLGITLLEDERSFVLSLVRALPAVATLPNLILSCLDNRQVEQ